MEFGKKIMGKPWSLAKKNFGESEKLRDFDIFGQINLQDFDTFEQINLRDFDKRSFGRQNLKPLSLFIPKTYGQKTNLR